MFDIHALSLLLLYWFLLILVTCECMVYILNYGIITTYEIHFFPIEVTLNLSFFCSDNVLLSFYDFIYSLTTVNNYVVTLK